MITIIMMFMTTICLLNIGEEWETVSRYHYNDDDDNYHDDDVYDDKTLPAQYKLFSHNHYNYYDVYDNNY